MGIQKPAEYVQFATGMNGDEDLGEDITMKGDKFHFVQNPLSANAMIQIKDEAEAKKEAKKAEKAEAKKAEAAKKVADAAKAEAKKEGKKEGKKAGKKEAAAKPDPNGIVYDTTGYSEPDKVHMLDPKITKISSTFS